MAKLRLHQDPISEIGHWLVLGFCTYEVLALVTEHYPINTMGKKIPPLSKVVYKFRKDRNLIGIGVSLGLNAWLLWHLWKEEAQHG